MEIIEREGKLVGGIGNVILGGESQGAQETLGTAIHLKDRFNTSIGGVFGLVGPVPLPPNGEQPLLHKTPILLYLGAKDSLYDPELCEFGYAYDGIMGPNTTFLVEKGVGHEYSEEMAAETKRFLTRIIESKNALQEVKN